MYNRFGTLRHLDTNSKIRHRPALEYQKIPHTFLLPQVQNFRVFPVQSDVLDLYSILGKNRPLAISNYQKFQAGLSSVYLGAQNEAG